MSDTSAGTAKQSPPAGSSLPDGAFPSGPFTVRPEWIDANGHLNLAYYILLFDEATDALWRPLGLGNAFRATGMGTFAVETHTLYRAELVVGETVRIDSIVLGADGKRLHVAHEMRRERDGAVSALQELMYLCVDLGSRKAGLWPERVGATLLAWAAAQAALTPDWVGRRVAMPVRESRGPASAG